ncbi:MAG TPA: hypothetical protein VND98_11115 [Solirubrobacterales bacterium]|nr:hypothetical protein [Solirubrobacterales bacterium]
MTGAGALCALALVVPSGASAACASTGGLTPATVNECAPTAKARLLRDGELIPPASAPPRVKAVIAAADRIRTKPYIWGGGHLNWTSPGYDCSGSVSYALHGGDFLDSPLPSGPMESWGLRGKGRWITVYANAGHAYAVIAGFRWDTAGDASGTGPRWHPEMLSNVGFVVRHPAGY